LKKFLQGFFSEPEKTLAKGNFFSKFFPIDTKKSRAPLFANLKNQTGETHIKNDFSPS
jgi:hypothetical protein